MSWTISEPPVVLKVPETRTRAGPPKSGSRGFEGLSAVNPQRRFGWFARGIEAEKLDGGGRALRFESVGPPWRGWDGQVRGLMWNTFARVRF